MPDAIFDDPRLARIYDVFDGPRDDLDAYLSAVRECGARSVLDVGCGTGSFALRAAALGIRVTAVDPAQASLDVARAKPGSTKVTWVHGDATNLPELRVDAAVMTGNVAQVFLTDDSWSATLDGIRGALKPGGYLFFESRNPAARVWEEWASDPAAASMQVPSIGVVNQRRELRAVETPYVSFRWIYSFPDGTAIHSDSTLRFRTPGEIEATLTVAELTLLEIRDAPDRPGREHVYIAQRS
ncbi:class I SAM-dependent methyltransferase [Gryllotalpicola reticulitermitis]|uniref:Class I SAM-dependent methyltransferase n=1 Tax=Gryllotalpicola reticulitermitis TaxID=1184153 RepID=A0ABV8Q4V7_9MICO